MGKGIIWASKYFCTFPLLVAWYYLQPSPFQIQPSALTLLTSACSFLSGVPNNPDNIIYCERKIHLIPFPTLWVCLSSLTICTIWQVYTRSNDLWKGQRMRKMCCYSSIWTQPASSGKWKADSLSSKLDSHAIFCPLPLASRKFPGFGSGISHPNRDSPFQYSRKKGDPITAI